MLGKHLVRPNLVFALVVLWMPPAADGAPDATDSLRLAGRLQEAAAQYERGESYADSLWAFECHLRSDRYELALAALDRALSRRPTSAVVKLWSDSLRGRPRPVPKDLNPQDLSETEAYLVGLYCRTAGPADRARAFLQAAYVRGKERPLFAIEWARSTAAAGDHDAAEEMLKKIAPSEEVALAQAELTLRRGQRDETRKLLGDVSERGKRDPRWLHLARLCGRAPDERRAVEKINRFWDEYIDSLEKFQAAGAKADYGRREWERFFEPWQARSEELLKAYPGTFLARRVRWLRSWCRARYFHHGYRHESRPAWRQDQVRAALGELLAIVHSHPETLLIRTFVRDIELLFEYVDPELSFASMVVAARRNALAPETRAAFAWHGAISLKRAGRAREAIPLFEAARDETAFLPDVSRRSLTAEIARATMVSKRAPFPVARIRLADGQELPLAGRGDKLLLLDFFDEDCGFCQGSTEDLRRLQREATEKRLDIVSVAVRGSDPVRWAKTYRLSWYMARDRDQKASVFEAIRGDGTPAYCLLDGQGRVVAIQSGRYGLRAIQRLLEERNRQPPR